MAEIVHGSITAKLPDSVAPFKEAGNLKKEEVKRIARAQDGIVAACKDAVAGITNAGTDFMLPKGVTPDALTLAAKRVEDSTQLIVEGLHMVRILRQTKLLYVREALRLVGQVNDQVKAQGKNWPALFGIFGKIVAYFKKARKPTSEDEKLEKELLAAEAELEAAQKKAEAARKKQEEKTLAKATNVKNGTSAKL